MQISYSHKFIFIHVSKSAGTSIQEALRPLAHNPESMRVNRRPARLGLRLRAMVPPQWRVFREHDTARVVQRNLPHETFDRFFKFAFVRNPWDWIVSLYWYLLETPSHRHHYEVAAMHSFEKYVEFETCRGRRSQHRFVANRRGELIVDFLGRFEHLEQDFQEVCDHLHVRASLPHINRTVHPDYREIHTERTIQMVASHFQSDIELFGYSFDQGPREPLRREALGYTFVRPVLHAEF